MCQHWALHSSDHKIYRSLANLLRLECNFRANVITITNHFVRCAPDRTDWRQSRSCTVRSSTPNMPQLEGTPQLDFLNTDLTTTTSKPQSPTNEKRNKLSHRIIIIINSCACPLESWFIRATVNCERCCFSFSEFWFDFSCFSVRFVVPFCRQALNWPLRVQCAFYDFRAKRNGESFSIA